MPKDYVSADGVDKVVEDIKGEINNIKKKIGLQEVGSYAAAKLSQSADSLQKLLNSLLLKKNIVTESDYDEAYEKLRQTRRSVLMIDFEKSKRWIYIAGGIVALVGLFYLYKRSNK